MWEYTSENLTAYATTWPERMMLLDELGAEGWELINIITDEDKQIRAILKRRLPETEGDD